MHHSSPYSEAPPRHVPTFAQGRAPKSVVLQLRCGLSSSTKQAHILNESRALSQRYRAGESIVLAGQAAAL